VDAVIDLTGGPALRARATMGSMRTIGPGSHGDDVRDVQARLAAMGYHIEPEEIGRFGSTTAQAVREFQQRRQLLVDGLVGPDTWEELVEAGRTLGDRVLYLRVPFHRGDDVLALQARLNILGFDAGRADGILGERTDRAVRDFQRNVGLPADGIVGGITLEALARLRPVAPGPGRASVREGEVLRRLSATLDGARVAVDAGHGGDDPGAAGPSGLTEADATMRLARVLADALRLRGADPFLLRTNGEAAATEDRARLANEGGAEILITLHLNSHADPRAEGASCYYYGRDDYVSRAGLRLAELIQEQLVSRLGLTDGRIHPKSLPLLRKTRMPAVHVEPCFITNPREEARLGEEPFCQGVAEALATALEQFLRAGAPAISDRHGLIVGARTAGPGGRQAPPPGRPPAGSV
jgi:N-acetylmuramoyl-L-alanine amidase